MTIQPYEITGIYSCPTKALSYVTVKMSKDVSVSGMLQHKIDDMKLLCCKHQSEMIE